MFSVLELSKMRMYQFHYDLMVKKYGKRLKLLRLNTDNFIGINIIIDIFILAILHPQIITDTYS
jgi:hypothetical protein